MDKFQINEQIDKLQTQLKMEIQNKNFEKASELKVQINRFKTLKDNYRGNYDLHEHASHMSYDELQNKISELSKELQGAVYVKDTENASNLSSELIKYQEIIRLIDLDQKNI